MTNINRMDAKCMNVWIVSYYEDGDKEATVTAFSNEEAAKLCYETFTNDAEYKEAFEEEAKESRPSLFRI